MLIAITRGVSPAINRCELTHLHCAEIDFAMACTQHRAYEAALRSCGVEVRSLPATGDLPDSVFVEDTAVVFDECAVIARPGAESRREETAQIARTLAPYRKLHHLQPPATLDGGDVLQIGRRVFVGRSTRTNPGGIDQLQMILAPYGYSVQAVDVLGCLHLKSAVTRVADDTLLLNPAWVDKTAIPGVELIEVDPAEPHAANALRIGNAVLFQPAFARTLKRLEDAGLRIVPVDMSELAKAEGGLTCCSLIFERSSAAE